MSVELIRELWRYHRWANRRLFDVAAALGEDASGRDVGAQFTEPTLRAMFAHLHASDRYWLDTWNGRSPAGVHAEPACPLAELRRIWDGLETEQQHFVAGVAEPDLERVVEGRTRDGRPFRRPLGLLLLHVPNHATHHRSEIATMLTMVSGSPPDTGINSYCAQQLGW